MAIKDEPVAAQYESWIYPDPIWDMAEAVATRRFDDVSDPSLVRRKLWPKKVEPDDLDILIAGCGSNQAAYFALTNPEARVVGIDLSSASLAHEAFLKEKHQLHNLELHQLNLEEASSLGRTFDLIVSSGVLHHIPDPAAGLSALREVLRPHGVVSLMLYGYYPRVGVHMLQDAFRILGLQQDAAGVAMVKHTLAHVLPAWHHKSSYGDADQGFDAGLVDTYLHAREEAYTVADVLQLIDDSGLKLQTWLDTLDYSISLWIPNPQDPLRRAIEQLPLVNQWECVELIGQGLARQFVLACHADKPATDYTLNFTGSEWLDYVPHLRYPIEILSGQPAGANEGASVPTLAIKRYGHRVELTPYETALLKRIDGRTTIIAMIEGEALTESNAMQQVEDARAFFQRMAGWDHLMFAMP